MPNLTSLGVYVEGVVRQALRESLPCRAGTQVGDSGERDGGAGGEAAVVRGEEGADWGVVTASAGDDEGRIAARRLWERQVSVNLQNLELGSLGSRDRRGGLRDDAMESPRLAGFHVHLLLSIS